MKDNAGVDPGPGPTRHPRPLTAADLHLQLEKEQEAVVCLDLLHHLGYSVADGSCVGAGQPPQS